MFFPAHNNSFFQWPAGATRVGIPLPFPPPHIEGIRIVPRRCRAGAFLLCRLHIYAFSMNNFYAKSEQVAQFTLVKRETRLASSAAADVAGLGNCCSIKVASTCRRGCNRCRERRGRGSSSGINLSTRPCLALPCIALARGLRQPSASRGDTGMGQVRLKETLRIRGRRGEEREG